MKPSNWTAESNYLLRLAEEIAGAELTATAPSAILLVGSSAEGVSDQYSDLDLCLYYKDLPDEDALARARDSLGAKNYFPLAPRSDRGVLETFVLRGVDCQLSHTTIEAWEKDLDSVLIRHEAGTVAQKAIEGLTKGLALYGNQLISKWRSRAEQYPEELRVAMIRHFLPIRPIWYIADRMSEREAAIFMNELRVEAVLGLLGVLAGLNRRYYSTFQLKRMGRLVGSFNISPENLALRLQNVFEVEASKSVTMIEALVSETIELVSVHCPEIDLDSLRFPPGTRQAAWEMDSDGNVI